MTEELKQDIFEYLEVLRLTGQVNMLSAPKLLVYEYDISKAEALEVFKEWISKENSNED